METKKRVGLWIRVSTEFQVKDESPEHHEKRGRYYAEAKHWDVVEVYRLDAVSGKSVLDHPEAKRMLHDIRNGHISGLIFSKLARLARNTKELLEISEIFRTYDADLISLQESIDTSTPAGRLFYTMIAAMAQWEREEIAERVAASVPIRAKMGKPLGGQASFGYKWEGTELVIDENEAPVRKLMYELFAKCKRKKTTAQQLNDLGYRTRNGSMFSDTTIDRLLRDTTAKGKRVANYTKSLGEGKKWVIKPKEEWIILDCPAIISEELWEECNAILAEQESRRKKPGRSAAHLLSGFVYCTCGKKMYVFHEKSAVYSCKACKRRISEGDLDEIYHMQLQNFLLTDDDVNDCFKKYDTVISEKATLLMSIQKEDSKLSKRIDELIDLRLAGELSKEAFAERKNPLEQRQSQIRDQIPELEAEIDFLKIQQISSDKINQEAKNLHARWPNMSFHERRSIVEIITDKIVVDKSEIDISLAYTPSLNTGKKQHDFRGSSKQST
jgi:site-specific DNA recombinase